MLQRIGVLATALTAVLLLGGCSGGDSASVDPERAAAEETAFCDAFGEVTAAATDAQGIAQVREQVAALGETAEPASMSESVRAGLELFVTLVADLPDEADAAAVEQLRAGLDEDQRAELAELDAYTQETCVPVE